MGDWLTPEQLFRLTKKRRGSVQCRVLAEMGVPFTPNALGEPLVSAELFFADSDKPKRKREPNWSAIRGKAQAA